MKYLKQFTIILAAAFAGEVLRALLPLPLPASLYGVALLFLGLRTRLIPLSAVGQTGRFLLEILPALFIPAAVGLLDAWPLVRGRVAAYAALVVGSTAVTLAAAGVVTQCVRRREARTDA